jgi:hypothetical protein
MTLGATARWEKGDLATARSEDSGWPQHPELATMTKNTDTHLKLLPIRGGEPSSSLP